MQSCFLPVKIYGPAGDHSTGMLTFLFLLPLGFPCPPAGPAGRLLAAGKALLTSTETDVGLVMATWTGQSGLLATGYRPATTLLGAASELRLAGVTSCRGLIKPITIVAGRNCNSNELATLHQVLDGEFWLWMTRIRSQRQVLVARREHTICKACLAISGSYI